MAPATARGLALAVLLGVVLAAASVGVLAEVPPSAQLTSAPQLGTGANQTGSAGSKVNSSFSTPSIVSGTSYTGTTVSGASPTTANSTSPPFLSVNDVASAITGLMKGTANSSLSQNASAATGNGPVMASQTSSDVKALAFKDLFAFGAAIVLALAALLVVRRRMS